MQICDKKRAAFWKRLLITRLAVQVRPGEPESTRPYSKSCRAFSGYGALLSPFCPHSFWDEKCFFVNIGADSSPNQNCTHAGCFLLDSHNEKLSVLSEGTESSFHCIFKKECSMRLWISSNELAFATATTKDDNMATSLI